MAAFHAARPASTALRLERIGAAVIRYGLALIIVWIGALKFAAYEAAAIEGELAVAVVAVRRRRCSHGRGRHRRRRDRHRRPDRHPGLRSAPVGPRQSRGDLHVSHHAELHAQHPRGVAAGLRVPVPVRGRTVPGQGPDPSGRGHLDGRRLAGSSLPEERSASNIGLPTDAVLVLGLGPVAGVERACFRGRCRPGKWRWRDRPGNPDGEGERRATEGDS